MIQTQNKNQIDMLNGTLWNKILLFALPIAASNILQQLFNSADAAVVGRFAGSHALAAVGCNGPVINLIINLFTGISIGANVVIANLIGRGEKEEVQKAVHTTVTFALVSGFFLIFAGGLLARPILKFISTPENVIDLSTLYLRIYFGGMPFFMLYNYGASILRSKGDTKRPLIALFCAGIINVLLNLLFVIRFHMGVAGVAFATVISQAVSSFLVFHFLLTETDFLKVDLRKFGISGKYLFKMMKIGLPAGLQGMVFSLSNITIQSAINTFGASGMAGSASELNYEMLNYFIVLSFNQTTTSFTSQNFGAGKYDRCKKIFKYCMLFSIAAMAFQNTFFVVFRRFFVSVFTTDPQAVYYGMCRMLVVMSFGFLTATYEITGSTLRAIGHSMLPAIISIVGVCVLRVIWVVSVFANCSLIPVLKDMEPFAVLVMVYPVSWIITGLAMLVVYCRISARLYR